MALSQTQIPPMPTIPPKVINSDEVNIEEASLTTALYLQDEWLITFGARNYWAESGLIMSTRGLTAGTSKDSELVGSLATNYAFTDDQSIRGLISQGYSYPTLLQMAMASLPAYVFYGH
jgi:hemoglobin/transferrin/lactoferrin receptor protein